MPNSADFIDMLVERFEPLGRIRSKNMFGGTGIYADDHFFCIVMDDTVYLKVDDATRPRYEELGMPAFDPMGGKPMRGYRQLPEEAMDDDRLLMELAEEAVAVARRSSAGEAGR